MLKRICLIAGLLALFCCFMGCGQNASPGNGYDKNTNKETDMLQRPLLVNDEREAVLVYYASENGRYVVPVTLSIKPTKEAAKVAVEKVLAGPGDWSLSPIVPEDTKLRDIYIKRNIAYIDLTRHFMGLKSYEDARLAVYSLVLTLTEFPEVEAVQVLIEGSIRDSIAGFGIKETFERPADANYLAEIDPNKEVLTVYYSDSNALYLIPVTVNLKRDMSPEERVFEAVTRLINGPSLESDLVKTIWPDTKIRAIKLDQESGQLNLDLSEDVIGYGGGSTAEMMLINSLLITLTGIEGVERVQLLIEGENVGSLPEGTDVSEPLSRPEHINFINP
jgi:germination protein M